jgi:hypothetical protein
MEIRQAGQFKGLGPFFLRFSSFFLALIIAEVRAEREPVLTHEVHTCQGNKNSRQYCKVK